mgnify:CR=1 FL=1|jgi:hypothetical protein
MLNISIDEFEMDLKSIPKRSPFRSISVNHDKKIIIISLRKVASSTIIKYIRNKQLNILKPLKLFFSNYEYVAQYNIYMVIRNPIDRFISAFKWFIYPKIEEYKMNEDQSNINIKINNFIDDIKNERCINNKWYIKLRPHWEPYLHFLTYNNNFSVNFIYDIKDTTKMLHQIDDILGTEHITVQHRKNTKSVDIVLNQSSKDFLNKYYHQEFIIYNKVVG